MSVIQKTSDTAANLANMRAIDEAVGDTKYRHVAAWGKWLGWAPATVKFVAQWAENDKAPITAIQNIAGEWVTVDGIAHAANREAVEKLLN